MVDISIVDGGYKLTNITGGYHIVGTKKEQPLVLRSFGPSWSIKGDRPDETAEKTQHFLTILMNKE